MFYSRIRRPNLVRSCQLRSRTGATHSTNSCFHCRLNPTKNCSQTSFYKEFSIRRGRADRSLFNTTSNCRCSSFAISYEGFISNKRQSSGKVLRGFCIFRRGMKRYYSAYFKGYFFLSYTNYRRSDFGTYGQQSYLVRRVSISKTY